MHPIVTAQLVRACESADAAHLARQVAAIAQLRPELGVTELSVAGGVAAFTDPAYGRKLNHVAGAWLDTPMSQPELAALRAAYTAHGVALEIDLCPYAPLSTLELLASAGASVNGYTNEYWFDTTAYRQLSTAHAGVRVHVAERLELEAFVAASVAGFAAQPKPRPHTLLEILARAAITRPDSLACVAEIDGRVAGTAAVALLETELGLVAHLYLASTLPEFRGRGVQAALLQFRLHEAHARGAKVATSTTRTGNSSGRNVERAGFRLAYTKPTFHL